MFFSFYLSLSLYWSISNSAVVYTHKIKTYSKDVRQKVQRSFLSTASNQVWPWLYGGFYHRWTCEGCYSEKISYSSPALSDCVVTPNGLSITKKAIKRSSVCTGSICQSPLRNLCLPGTACSSTALLCLVGNLTVNLAFVKRGKKWLSAITSRVEPSVQSEHPVSLVMAGLLQ